MVKILKFKKEVTIIKLNATVTNLKCPGNFNVLLVYTKRCQQPMRRSVCRGTLNRLVVTLHKTNRIDVEYKTRAVVALPRFPATQILMSLQSVQ
jgi:hypothetical protein